eukprot:CAMPEP_0173336574 /NCGR_PEP_ID=MMETSP1144-20121109/6624_1 /TAXON_ID=483371 /ORGANISM="non described non described, Strain CCMP2298" /LENGTH=93 /DNA_ID=CAMNT_0014281865 /DNA_START=43 /DNA_END=321 /DNA_ORIENTATION=-
MAEKGYEKVKAAPKPVEEAEVDFKSQSWDTSLQYRTQAVPEICLNFPCLKKAGIKTLFGRQKGHFFHTVGAIERATGLRALRIVVGGVQYVAG